MLHFGWLLVTIVIALARLIERFILDGTIHLLLGWLREMTDDLVYVVVSAGVIHHIKDGDECILFSISERTTIYKMICPLVMVLKHGEIPFATAA